MDTLPSGVVRVASPAEGAWKAGEEWRLVEELRIGSAEAEGPQMFGEVAALEVDRLGRIWVPDPANARYSVHDTTGALVTSHAVRSAGTACRGRGASTPGAGCTRWRSASGAGLRARSWSASTRS